MIELRFLYRIDYKLRAIFVQLDRFFDDLNIMLCENFAQLSSMKNTSFYSQSRHFNSKILIAINVYQVFKKSIFFIKLMRQEEMSSSTVQFRDTLLEMRDNSVSADNWQFLLTRSKERLSLQE
jgi:hypothetical protein